mgnify:CR=1 FL=1
MTINATYKEAADMQDRRQSLAQALVKRLGRDGAKQTCRENHWHGVLAAVNDMRGVGTA